MTLRSGPGSATSSCMQSSHWHAQHDTSRSKAATMPTQVGLSYICATAERFFAVSAVLNTMVAALPEQPSVRLLKHIIRCYLRLSDNSRAREALRQCLPPLLLDGGFTSCLKDDGQTRGFESCPCFHVPCRLVILRTNRDPASTYFYPALEGSSEIAPCCQVCSRHLHECSCAVVSHQPGGGRAGSPGCNTAWLLIGMLGQII